MRCHQTQPRMAGCLGVRCGSATACDNDGSVRAGDGVGWVLCRCYWMRVQTGE
jgi:hypothetical protein